MGQELELRTTQKLVMTPMLQHALKMLQLPTLELNDVIQHEIAENPMLEEKEPEAESDTGNEDMEMQENGVREPAAEYTQEVNVDEAGMGPEGFNKEEWERYFSDDDYSIPKYDRETTREVIEQQIAKPPTQEEHLLWQLRLICADEEEYRIGELIIGNLDDRGFLPLSLAEIARQAGTDEDQVADVLTMIQGLEPLGIAARNVTESLLIQLRNKSERNSVAESIVERHFSALERHQFDQIARAEKISRSQVVAAAQLIAGLDPFPGRHQFSEDVQYVTPDVIVEKHDDEYIIIVNDGGLPELKISRTYRQLLRRQSQVTPETRKYLEEKLQRAIWLMRSIEQRRRTLYRVVENIVEIQRDFFEKGVACLKPLTLREISERVELHESTISRVTSKKYAQTPRGLYELKYFFSSQIKTMDGTTISSTSVKAALRELIEREDARRPLSDQRLTRLLAEKGFEIARRTVAKYREEMNLLPASRRKLWE